MFTILVYDIKLVIYNQVMTKQYKQTVNCAPVFRSFSLSFFPLPSLFSLPLLSSLRFFSLLSISPSPLLFTFLLSFYFFSFLFASPLLTSLLFPFSLRLVYLLSSLLLLSSLFLHFSPRLIASLLFCFFFILSLLSFSLFASSSLFSSLLSSTLSPLLFSPFPSSFLLYTHTHIFYNAFRHLKLLQIRKRKNEIYVCVFVCVLK